MDRQQNLKLESNVAQRAWLIRITVVSVLAVLSVPAPVFAHGGGGHGGGHGGGGGGRGFSPGVHGYTGGGHRGPAAAYGGHFAGYRGYGPGYRGYGWGHPGYGWGYPYYGYGLGLGLGLGLGYGIGSGYGYGYGYPAYGAYYSGTYVNASTTNTSNTIVTQPVVTASVTTTDDSPSAKGREFIERGMVAFKAGKYDDAVYAWRHAVVDAPQYPLLVLQLGQALFAIGKYEESAGATQAALRQLPKEEWGAVVRRYQDYYGKSQDYTHQLKSLEKALKNKPNDPALRFLAGYHYGYLGFFKQSIEQLDKVIEIEPRDEIAKQLRDEMNSQRVNVEAPPAVPAPVPALN